MINFQHFFQIFIHIFSDQPEIEQEETFIHTQEGDETEVICVVHASPKAEIKWFKVSYKFGNHTQKIVNKFIYHSSEYN